MILGDLINGLTLFPCPQEWSAYEVGSIETDSRRVREGSVFVAVPGAGGHGRGYLQDAVRAGAGVLVAERIPMEAARNPRVCCLTVPDPQDTLVGMLKRFYACPGQGFDLIAVTGTNGKTTLTYLMESVFHSLGRMCGVIGTVNHRVGPQQWPALNTTPGLVENYRLLSEMARYGAQVCVMEVSSHALAQERVRGIRFGTAVFTNLTRDHMDYHRDQEEYFRAKSLLFRGLCEGAAAVINTDDPFGRRLTSLVGPGVKVLTYAVENTADICARQIRMSAAGTELVLVFPTGEHRLTSALIGRHNVYNLLAAAAAATAGGLMPEQIVPGLQALTYVPGRLERIDAGQSFSVFVDYAHTDDALEHVLTSLRALKGKGRLTVVFGCGGDRDKDKRPRMGEVAGRLADAVIITNDNPRTEDPEDIAGQIAAGVGHGRFRVILDRAQAIRSALEGADRGDVVLIAGKGHEDYQIFGTEKIPFDDRRVAGEVLGLHAV